MAEITDVTDNVRTRLLAVQKELASKRLKKSAENPFHKNKYVDLPALLEFVLPELHKQNLLLLQPVTYDDERPILTTAIHSTITGDSLEASMLLMLKTEDPQAQGSAITYARRYALMSMLGLVGNDDDDDGQAASVKAREQSTDTPAALNSPPATAAQKKMITGTFNRKGFTNSADIDRMVTNISGANSLNDLTKKEASTVIEKILVSDYAELAAYMDDVIVTNDESQEV